MTQTPKKRLLILLIFALAAVGTIVWLKSKKVPVEAPVVSASAPVAVDYTAKVNRLVAAARTDDEAALKRYTVSLKNLEFASGVRFDAAAENAATIASSNESIVHTLYFLAYDQINTTQETDVYLSSRIKPLLTPVMTEYVGDVNHATSVLENDLRVISVTLAMHLAALGPGAPSMPTQMSVTATQAAQLDQTLKNLGINAAGIGVSLAFDAFAISEAQLAKRLLRSITSLAGRLFAKQVSKVAASITAAVVDGPLPFGDLIALAGLVWTGHDVYAMQQQFHDEIKTVTRAELATTTTQINRQALANAAAKVESFRVMQAEIGKKSLAELSL